MRPRPITKGMDTTLVRVPRTEPAAADLLLRHCLVVGGESDTRLPASVRLEEALGPELARRLVTCLTAGGRR